MAGGDAAEMIARTGLVLVDRQRLVRSALVQVLTADAHHEARARRSWFEFDQRHVATLPALSAWARSGLARGFVIDALACGQLHICLLGVLGTP